MPVTRRRPTLEEAQENKYRLIFDKLRLQEGDRLLDIGCGWGGMVRYAARRGVRAIGATLSREQAVWAQRAIDEEGLGGLAEVRFSDYRDIRETGFDAVSSIGLTEHIGVRNYPTYFAAASGIGCGWAGCCSTTASPAPTTGCGRPVPSSTATSSWTAS